MTSSFANKIYLPIYLSYLAKERDLTRTKKALPLEGEIVVDGRGRLELLQPFRIISASLARTTLEGLKMSLVSADFGSFP